MPLILRSGPRNAITGRTWKRMNLTPMSWMRRMAAQLTPRAVSLTCLPKSDQQWVLPEMAEKACKRICGLLNAVPLRCCRADLVIRRAFITRG
jgi:hypothetical protein